MAEREGDISKNAEVNPYLEGMVLHFTNEALDYQIPVEVFSDAYQDIVQANSLDRLIFTEGVQQLLSQTRHPRVSLGTLRVAIYTGLEVDDAVFSLQRHTREQETPELKKEIDRYWKIREARKSERRIGLERKVRLSARVVDFIQSLEVEDL